METITCQTKPIMEGFEFRQMIEENPEVFTRSMKTPAFEALGRQWRIKTKYDKYYREQDNGHQNRLHIKLFPVDNEGNKMDLSGVKNEPYYKKSISLLMENGKQISFLPVTDECDRFEIECSSQMTKQILNALKKRGAVQCIQILYEFHFMVDQKVRLTSSSAGAESADTIDIKRLLGEDKFADFSIRTGDGKVIRAHRAVLFLASPYFEAMFNSGGVECEKGEIEVPESFEVMNALIHSLYTGKAPQADGKVSAVDLFIAADKYQVEGLKDQLEVDVDALFYIENVCAELIKAHTEGVQCMKSKAAEFISARRKEVLGREDWRGLCRDHPELVSYIFAP